MPAASYTRLCVISFDVVFNGYTQFHEDGVQLLNEKLVHYGVTMPGYNVDYARVVWVSRPQVDPRNHKEPQHRQNVCTTMSCAYSEVLSRLTREEARNPIVLVILPTRSIPLYSDVKWWADCVQGVHTVCVTHKKLLNPKQDLLANIW